MGDLKPGWRRMKFGDVVRLVKETCKDPMSAGIERVIGLEHLEPGDLRVRSWANAADGTTFTSRVRPGQVLFGKRRAYQRKVAVADFDAICSGDIYVFESADPSKLHPELLPFLCQTDAFFEHAVGTSAGSLSPRTNWSSLAEYEFLLPSLEEQRRIAELMRAAETALAAYRDAADATALMLKSLRNALLSQGQDGSGNWPTVTLQDVALGKNGIVDGPFGSNLKTIHFRDRGHPVIASSMFTNGRFEPTLDEYRYVDNAKFEQLIRNRVHGGDIVVVLIGVNCGTAAVLPDDHPPGVITQNCLKISVNPSVCSREYLLATLRWMKETGRLERLVTSTQQRALSLGRLRGQRIPLPPRGEQQRITDALRELEEARDALRVRESQLRQVRLRHMSHISPGGDAQ